MFCGFNVSCIGDELNHSFILSKYKDSPSDESLLLIYKKLKLKTSRIFISSKRK